ncbi:MAG: phenylalanine--tRNA ligase subunit alpha, partial [Solibacillus isronensis]
MEQQLKQLEQEALAKIAHAADLKALNDVRVAYLGKKGPITD